MLGRHPRFECGKQQIGRNSSQHAAKQENAEIVGMLKGVDDNLQNTIHDTRFFSTEFINKATQKWSKDGTTQEPRNEQSRNIDIVR
mmetsp:Transcript_28555/g.77281  ORF Transcript_28555/g.77281 Transcript_28555/m.77281 type:complete len:86 (+) Transcript_28555:1236-1493(+)